MIAHVLRLSIGEGLKIRRRWIPWILLGLVVLISQGILWGSYVAHHVSDDPFGALIPPYEYNDTEGSIVVTCKDVVEGRAEEKFALISGKLPMKSARRPARRRWNGATPARVTLRPKRLGKRSLCRTASAAGPRGASCFLSSPS